MLSAFNYRRVVFLFYYIGLKQGQSLVSVIDYTCNFRAAIIIYASHRYSLLHAMCLPLLCLHLSSFSPFASHQRWNGSHGHLHLHPRPAGAGEERGCGRLLPVHQVLSHPPPLAGLWPGETLHSKVCTHAALIVGALRNQQA